jgi:hypothetical protein
LGLLVIFAPKLISDGVQELDITLLWVLGQCGDESLISQPDILQIYPEKMAYV